MFTGNFMLKNLSIKKDRKHFADSCKKSDPKKLNQNATLTFKLPIGLNTTEV